ncbi:MAG TPA: sensor histidine kinase KdpD [Negativicutes bacterium]|nr:sensor histidine kinase KdpD [Negativicutes bacterium]
MSTNRLQDERPNPDILLEKVNKAERGKLTVFLGAAAGVGKTYAMLEVAQERFRAGTDIVIGWVETHGRAETESMVAGLERIPPQRLFYRETQMLEMDIDAILTRRPEVVLVDELAHTNVPGARHLRRFQDVDELLKAGIHVYTTLNVQHLESLNDVVAKITGIIVRETVPDYVLEQADNIKLIDISSDDLIHRLKEGKVYVAGQAEQAMKQFFRLGNINALRELALRYTARQVDKNLSDYMRDQGIEGPWPAAGRIMVCVSASPFSTQLIRAAHRLATGLQAELIAVYVEVRHRSRSFIDDVDQISRNMKLAEELGAMTLSTHGDSLETELLEIARLHNVTAIVMGKPRHSRFREFFHGSVVDRLIRRSGDIHVYVIQINSATEKPSVQKKQTKKGFRWEWKHYAASLCMVLSVTVFGLVMKERIEVINVALLYQLPVTLSAFWWGRWPSYFTAVISVLFFDFLFIPPTYTFTVEDVRYMWSFFTFLIVAFVIGGRTEYLRNEASAARQRERSTAALYQFSREIAAVVDKETIVRELALQVSRTLGRNTRVILPDANGRLSLWADQDPGLEWTSLGRPHQALPKNNENAVAMWAYTNGQVAGRTSETLSGADYLYLPMITRETVVGVLGVRVLEKIIAMEQRQLMNAWAGLAAIAIERGTLMEKERETALLVESDKLRTALLNSVSHELRTPLSSIIGSVSTLLESEIKYSPQDQRELLINIKDGANRMERVVANLLDTARLESGMVQLKLNWCDMEDIIGTALRRLQESIRSRNINVDVQPPINVVHGDCVLLEQLMINLVDNAVKYSPANTPVDIKVSGESGNIIVSVSDRGIGIPEDELSHIFNKFYQVHHPDMRVDGTGLGLSICRGIVEAHGGKIWAENRPGGGTSFLFMLPATTSEFVDSGANVNGE